tara:strand:- start:11 stop:244 length:234 start_codon:yes stop_codon:yes gene_type:complete
MLLKRIRIMFLLIISLPYLPTYGAQSGLLKGKNAYCNIWADRFLSLKDGINYSSEKFSMYIKICKNNYIELRKYYKN